ncbi:MAG: HlyD family secretion protein [Anaerolineaceae bacterium]|nr:HlyD family secretion protein [Anaerolineaceae bacterium]
MNKKFFLILTLIGLSALLVACDTFTVSQPTPVVYESFQDDAPGLIIAEGEIVPENDLQIISHTNGRVQEILVEEGQMVAEGQSIIKLEVPEQLLAELKSAELEQLKSQKALDDLILYGNLQKQKAYQRVLDAQSARRAALKSWDEFDEDQYEEDLEAIKEDIIDARKELEDAKEDLKDFLDLEEDNPQRVNRQEDVDEAQIALNELEREQAALEQTYDQLQLNLALTKAEEETAWNEYRKFKQEDVPEDQFKLLQEQLDTANARINAIETSIADFEITTPIEGTLVQLNVQKGEWIYTGQMIAIVADFSTWFVESTDTNELEIVDIQVGDTVTLEFDAFPDETVRGRVIEINEFPVMKYNDVIYPIRIELLDNDLPLRWKMSVIITIER